MGVSGNQSFDSICPKTLCSLSPTPMMLNIKFDQNWPSDFRDIQVQMCEIFVTQGQVTPKIRPNIEFDRAFMLVLVTSNFDDESIKNERAKGGRYCCNIICGAPTTVNAKGLRLYER